MCWKNKLIIVAMHHFGLVFRGGKHSWLCLIFTVGTHLDTRLTA